MIESQRHQQQPQEVPVTSDSLRRLQLALEAQIVAAGASGVSLWNGRSGNVSMVAGDVNTALGYTPAPSTLFTSTLNGLAPASGGGTTNFLRADGSWAAPPAGGGYTPPTGTGFAHITAGSQDAAAKLVDTADITDGAVSLVKMANMATASVIYRKTGGAGAPEVQTLATLKTDLGLTGTNTGDQTITLTGDVTGSGTGSFATTIPAGTITLGKQADMATASVVYRKTAGAGPPEVQSLATLKTDLGLTGTNSGDQTITLTGDVTGSGTGSFATTIPAGTVTLAKMANMATASVIYRKTAGAGVPEVQTLATLKTDLGLTGTNSGDQTITLTGDVTGSGTGSFAATIAAGAVTLGKNAPLAANSVIGNNTGSTATPIAVGNTALRAMLSINNVDNTADSAKNVLSATKLTTARTINGVSFDGTANITINAVDSTARVPETRTISTTAPLAGGGALSGNLTLSIAAATTSLPGSMSAADKTKLDGVATGATANSSDAFLLSRANHTGTQAASTLTGTLTLQVISTGGVFSSHATTGLGYSTGAGGTVTQLTSKSTGVTLNKVCGQIVTHNASLAGNSSAFFTLTNSAIAATDNVLVQLKSGASDYIIHVDAIIAGSCRIQIWNRSGGALADVLTLNFSVIKAVTS